MNMGLGSSFIIATDFLEVIVVVMMMEHFSGVYSHALLHCCFISLNPHSKLGSVTDQRFSRCSALESQSGYRQLRLSDCTQPLPPSTPLICGKPRSSTSEGAAGLNIQR